MTARTRHEPIHGGSGATSLSLTVLAVNTHPSSGQAVSGGSDPFFGVFSYNAIDYLVTKTLGRKKTKLIVHKLLNIFQIAEVNKEVVLLSTDSKFSDFEGAVQHFAGQLVSVDSIVTRNNVDFKQAEYPVYSPDELWGIIQLNM